jgi:hypothetical protein
VTEEKKMIPTKRTPRGTVNAMLMLGGYMPNLVNSETWERSAKGMDELIRMCRSPTLSRRF